jgi:hypothetical protein
LIAECANYDLHSGFIYTAHAKRGNSELRHAFDVDVHLKSLSDPAGLVKLLQVYFSFKGLKVIIFFDEV